MKTERVTLLTSPEFKLFLAAEARREGVSVAELVRSRCERPSSAKEEAELRALTAELRAAIEDARRALRSGIDEAQSVLDELRAARSKPSRHDRGARSKLAA